uniref:Zinc finger protein 62 n=1 Tax=Culex pipiens TaxID=7175 RepID=A0A8D8FC31_CULPI
MQTLNTMSTSTTDMTAYCRVCMATPEAGFSSLYESSSSSGQPSLHGMLSVICAPIFAKPAPEESTPKWPANACETCKNAIVAAFKLHQQCIETDRQLNKIFAVKLEVEEEVVEEAKDNIDDPLEEIKVEPLEVMMVELDENDAADDDKSDDGGDNSSDSDWEEDDTEKRTCKVCSKVVDKVSQLGKHMKKEHPERTHVCRICSESFKSYSGLQYHKVTHKGPATCDECGKTFVTKGSLNNHQKLGHCHGKKYPFAAEAGKKKSSAQSDQSKTCKVCGEVQKNAYALNVHVKKLHADCVLHCDQCNLVFFKPYGLEKHKKSHASGQFSVCKICKEEFPTRDAMRYHMRNHDGPFNCTVCDKLIHTKTALTTHMKRHSGHKPFSCEMCPMKFFSRMEKIQHMVTHTKVRDHVCDLCGSGFTKSDSLIKHKIRVHEKLRPFPCTLCTLKFANSHQLQRHMRTHTGEKPYKCHYCDRAYSQSNDLVKHTKIHVGAHPYACDRCDESFRLLTELRQHYQVHVQAGDDPKLPDELSFTSVATLNRRFDKERQQQKVGEAVNESST